MLARTSVLDLYRPLLEKALFPAYEAARGRPTVPLLRYLEGTERWSLERLVELQLGQLRRLLRHAYLHTLHYRGVLDGLASSPRTSTASTTSAPCRCSIATR
jgi:hypothetical protein